MERLLHRITFTTHGLMAQSVMAGLLGCGLAARAALPVPIQLPPPQTSGGKPLLQALAERKTTREFSPRPLSPQLLSNLLWAGFGINRPHIAHRTAPSAMNSQETDIYLATEAGVFLYEAGPHRLRPVLGEDVRPKTGNQDFVKAAPVALIFVADLSRLAKAPPPDRERYAWMDCGYISQNIYLFCASEELATVVHELKRAPLKEALGLKPDQAIILVQSVGFPKEPPSKESPR